MSSPEGLDQIPVASQIVETDADQQQATNQIDQLTVLRKTGE
jgi:hypothetical protein